MGRPSKFTADRRERILQAKRVGASNVTASRVAGIDPATLRDWLKRGETGPKDSNYRKFLDDFEEAAAHPRERALGIIYNALPDRPDLAWKYVERQEEGYAAPIVNAPAIAAQPVNITLSFFEAARPVSEVTVVAAEPDQTEPAELEAGSSHRSA
jgi:hypothetical protein